jgi:prephenate dehydrogenase
VPPLFERVTIAGVGLIGGSLALAARRAGLVGEVVGLGRGAANLATALQRRIIDRATHDPQDAVRDSDLVVLAVPVASVAALAQACAPGLPTSAIVTDVGSVKAAVLREVEPILPPGVAFVGAHPIAGTESSGAAAADAELFRGRRCVLTPGSLSTPEATAKLRALWEGVGMQVTEMAANRHDAIMAWVSHLPHALAFGIVDALRRADPDAAAFAGPSFASLTRVAASAPETWTDIFLANAAALDAATEKLIAALQELRQSIATRDAQALTGWLEAVRATHLAWRSKAGTPSSAA